MFGFIIRKCLTIVSTTFALLVITFVISHLTPGDPAALAAGPDATKEMIQQIREEFGLDRPLPIQFVYYVGGVVQGDFGTSIHTGRSVAEDLLRFFPATLELVLFSILIAVILGVPIGVISAVRQNTMLDHSLRFLSVSGVGLPMFWLGLMLQLYFAQQLGWFPLGGRLGLFSDPPTTITSLYILDALLTLNFSAALEATSYIVLPAVTLCFPALASIARVNRAEMIEVMSQDYIVNAKAHGISNFRIIAIYGLRNAMLPTLAMIGLRFGWMLGGTVLVESVFNWPGVGLYAVDAAIASDFEPIIAVTVLLGLMFMLANLIIDILYGVLDPRVRGASV